MKIEGKNAVLELLKTDKKVDRVVLGAGQRDGTVREIVRLAAEKGVRVQWVDRASLKSDGRNGRAEIAAAYAEDYAYRDLSDLVSEVRARGEELFFVVLDGVEDPHNLGAIVRVCECAGVNGLVIGERRAAAVNETVMRVSAGAANHLPVARVANIPNAIRTLQEAGAWATALELGGEELWSCDLTGDLCLVVGGEDCGVHRLSRETCDRVASIPLRGKVNSLNASVACGVAVFEALRQRSGRGKK